MEARADKASIPVRRLVREAKYALDTPALISVLAHDKDLMKAVFRVLNPVPEVDDGFIQEFDRACRQENVTALDLKRRLVPAAAALGLSGTTEYVSEVFYDTLRVPFDASVSSIRKAYRRRARELHPDTNPDADPLEFVRLTEAYRVLSNPKLREEYDARQRRNPHWEEKHHTLRRESFRNGSLRHRQRRRMVFQLIGAAVFLLVTIGFIDQYFKEQSLLETQPARKASIRTEAFIPADPEVEAPVHAPPETEGPDSAPGLPVLWEVPAGLAVPKQVVNEDAPLVAALSPTKREASTEEPVDMKKAPVSESAARSPEEPLFTEKLLGFERPVILEKPMVAEKSVFAEKPAVVEEPAVTEGPLVMKDRDFLKAQPMPEMPASVPTEETPSVAAMTPANREARREEPVDMKRASSRETAGRLPEEPAVTGEPAVVQEPVVTEGPLVIKDRDFLNAQPMPEKPEPAPIEEVPSVAALRLEADPLKMIEGFISSYCRAYEALSYERFMEHFAGGALENDQAVKDLRSTYRSNFDRLQAVNYNIEVKHYTINNGMFEVRGDYVLRWRFKGAASWKERRGPIFMALVPSDEDALRVKRLVYH